MQQRSYYVFATKSAKHLWEAVQRQELDGVSFEPGYCEQGYFQNGDPMLTVSTEVAGRHCVILCSLRSNNDENEMRDLCAVFRRMGARSISLVISNFGGQTMERAPGGDQNHLITADARAKSISHFYQGLCFPNQVHLLDLHSEGIPQYFNGDLVQAHHVYCEELWVETFARHGVKFVSSTDAGRLKWVESLAKRLSVDTGVVLKHRLSEAETELAYVLIRNIEGCEGALFDDILRTGGSASNAGQACLDSEAKGVVLGVTHLESDRASLRKLRDSGVFRRILCLNTTPFAHEISQDEEFSDFVEVGCASPVIMKALAKRGNVLWS